MTKLLLVLKRKLFLVLVMKLLLVLRKLLLVLRKLLLVPRKLHLKALPRSSWRQGQNLRRRLGRSR